MFALDARQVTKHEGLTTDYETVAYQRATSAGSGKTLHLAVVHTSALRKQHERLANFP